MFRVLSVFQSGYFSSMFSGSWRESNMMVIELEIPDQNIDTEGEIESQIKVIVLQNAWLTIALTNSVCVFTCACV